MGVTARCYVSSQLNGLPSRFEFDSRIILTANTLPKKNAAFQALLSRMDTFHMTATNDEVIAQMRAWARRGFRSLTPAQVCFERWRLPLPVLEVEPRPLLYAVLFRLGGESGQKWYDESDRVLRAACGLTLAFLDGL